MAFPTVANTNVEYTTKDLWKRTIASQVILRNPLMAALFLARRFSWEGGKSITRSLAKATAESLVQDYTVGTPLTSQRKTYLTNAYFLWKFKQLPVVLTVEEKLYNMGGGDTAPVDFSAFLVQEAQRSMRLKLRTDAYGAGADGGAAFQGLNSALVHDATYGTISRGTTVTNSWWQGASMDETFADQGDANTVSIDLTDKMMDAVTRKETVAPSRWLYICGEAIYRNLKKFVRAKRIDTQTGMLAKFGFQSFTIDGVEFVKDPYLITGQLTDAHKRFYLIDLNCWEYRIHPQRSFLWTGMTWQGNFTNGADEDLGRIMLMGNLVCWQPNANIYLSNVS